MRSRAAIVDYGLGNLFSLRQACKAAGLDAIVTSDRREILSAPIVILPGVGAFGDAMQALRTRDLVEPLQQYAAADKPLFGICLGMQLLMDRSCEFGSHDGLGIIGGSVELLPAEPGLKVPQIGWNRVNAGTRSWTRTPLEGTDDGAFYYFVHSYYVLPADPAAMLATSRFGNMDYCSVVRSGSVVGVQFHPEKSGRKGIAVFSNLLRLAQASQPIEELQ